MAAGLCACRSIRALTRADLVGAAAARRRARAGHACVVCREGGRPRGEVESLQRVIVHRRRCAALDYETLLAAASEYAACRGSMATSLRRSISAAARPGRRRRSMLRHRNLMTVAQHTAQGFEIAADAVFLNVRPLWPIAQVILMSYLYAGRDGGAAAASMPSAGPTPSRRPARPAPRWCRRTLCADSSICSRRDPRLATLEAIYVGGSRIPPGIFERALDAFGPKIGVLYGLTEAPVTCYLPPRSSMPMPAPSARSCSRSGARCRATRCELDGARRSGRRRGSDPRRQRHGRLLARRGSDPRGLAATAGCTPATSAQFDEDGQPLHRRPAQGGDPLRHQHHRPEGGRGRDRCCIRRSPRSRCSGCPMSNGARRLPRSWCSSRAASVSEHELDRALPLRISRLQEAALGALRCSLPRSHYGKVLARAVASPRAAVALTPP